MEYRRAYHTLTVLPDGKVLATGGQTETDGVDETTGIVATEMWDPDTDTWTTMAAHRRPRLYHSSALLLPDGRVLLAGGGAFGAAKNEDNGEIYSPPYLFKGPRPSIAGGPSTLNYGQQFTLNTPDADRIRSATMVRMGSVTHNLDMDQRFMNLTMSAGAGSVQLQSPSNANVAPPGMYMVFLIDDQGVPSVGHIVKVEETTDTHGAEHAERALGHAPKRQLAAARVVALDRQRGCRRVQGAPLHDGELHAKRRQPSGHRGDRHHLHQHRSGGRDLLLQGGCRRRRGEHERPVRPGASVTSRRRPCR